SDRRRRALAYQRTTWSPRAGSDLSRSLPIESPEALAAMDAFGVDSDGRPAIHHAQLRLALRPLAEVADCQTLSQPLQAARDLFGFDFRGDTGQEDAAERRPWFVERDRDFRVLRQVRPPRRPGGGSQPHRLAVPLVPERHHVGRSVRADAGELGAPQAG